MAQRVVLSVPVEWARLDRFPPICAFSGRWATGRKRYRVAGDRPRWTLLLLIPAVFPYLLLADRWATRAGFHLPIARPTRWRWVIANAVTVSSLGLSVAAFFLSGREGNRVLLAASAGLLGMFAVGLVLALHRQQVPRIRQGRLILPRVHPAFAEAVQHAFVHSIREKQDVPHWDGATMPVYPTLSESLAS